MRNAFQKSLVPRDMNISKKEEIISRYVIKCTERRFSWKNINTYILYKTYGIFNVGKHKISFLSLIYLKSNLKINLICLKRKSVVPNSKLCVTLVVHKKSSVEIQREIV